MLTDKQLEAYVRQAWGYIYRTTNLLTGDYYIGRHITKEGESWASYLGAGSVIRKEIVSYGRDNFRKELVALVSRTDAAEVEALHIKQAMREAPLRGVRCLNIKPAGGSLPCFYPDHHFWAGYDQAEDGTFHLNHACERESYRDCAGCGAHTLLSIAEAGGGSVRYCGVTHLVSALDGGAFSLDGFVTSNPTKRRLLVLNSVGLPLSRHEQRLWLSARGQAS